MRSGLYSLLCWPRERFEVDVGQGEEARKVNVLEEAQVSPVGNIVSNMLATGSNVVMRTLFYEGRRICADLPVNH